MPYQEQICYRCGGECGAIVTCNDYLCVCQYSIFLFLTLAFLVSYTIFTYKNIKINNLNICYSSRKKNFFSSVNFGSNTFLCICIFWVINIIRYIWLLSSGNKLGKWGSFIDGLLEYIPLVSLFVLFGLYAAYFSYIVENSGKTKKQALPLNKKIKWTIIIIVSITIGLIVPVNYLDIFTEKGYLSRFVGVISYLCIDLPFLIYGIKVQFRKQIESSENPILTKKKRQSLGMLIIIFSLFWPIAIIFVFVSIFVVSANPENFNLCQSFTFISFVLTNFIPLKLNFSEFKKYQETNISSQNSSDKRKSTNSGEISRSLSDRHNTASERSSISHDDISRSESFASSNIELTTIKEKRSSTIHELP